MNVEEARRRVAEIAEKSHKPEVAHGMEDDLYLDFVEWAGEEAPSPFAEVAREVLKAHDLEFSRWYA